MKWIALLLVAALRVFVERDGARVEVPVTPALERELEKILAATQPAATEATGPKLWRLPTKDGWLALPAPHVTIHVDSREGNDATGRPFKTLARAARALPEGKPWALEISGEFAEPFPKLPKQGDPACPNVVRGKGGLRAVVRWQDGQIAGYRGLVLMDLHVVGPANGRGNGLRFWDCSYVAVENCYVTGFCNGLVFETPERKPWGRGLIVRRSLFVGNAPPADHSRHSQGSFVHRCRGYFREDVYYDFNGWSPRVAGTQFNQNDYTNAENDECESLGIVSANAAATGDQFRAGGIVRHYVSIDNPAGATYGLVNGNGHAYKGGIEGELSHAVFVGGRNTGQLPRGMALEIANVKRARVSDVYILDPWMTVNTSPLALKRGTRDKDGKKIRHPEDVGIGDLTLERVYCFGTWPKGRVEEAPRKLTALKCWVPGVATDGQQPKPPRGVDEYARALGLKDRQELVLKMRSQGRRTWDERLTARAICEYVERSFVENN